MKIIIVFLFFFLAQAFNASAFDFFNLPALIQHPREYLLSHPDELKEKLESSLVGRCNRYLPNKKEECEFSAKEFMSLLNLSSVTIEDESYIVSLSTELESVYKDKRLHDYLIELNTELQKIESDFAIYKFINTKKVKNLDLGEMTLKHFKNPKYAMKVMAVLFQDIFSNGVPAHLTYLHEKFGDSDELNLLLSINNKIGTLLYADGTSPIKIFGTIMYSSKIYHYLVPGYLAVKMGYLGKSKDISFFFPFMFNFLYELTHGKSPVASYFFEPKFIDDRETQNDIRLGEMGAAFGVEKEGLVSESTARDLLIHNPTEYVKNLIQKIAR
jgi:hypothetical protein